MKPLRVAVVGAGHLGRIHARILSGLEGFSLVGVADPLEASRRETAVAHHVEAFADHRRLLGRIDAAVVAAPTKQHHAVALDLLAGGVHLFVEKPLAATLAEAQELVDAARRRGALLQVGHVERFNPAFAAVLPHVREPKYIEAVRRGGFTFRSTDIGVVLDLMIHDIDLVLSLVRSPLRSVEALGVSLFGRREDIANARLHFENGCVASLSASRASHGAARTMQIWSRRAFAGIDFAARTATIVRPSDALLRRELDVEQMSIEEKTALKDRLMTEHLPVEQIQAEPCDAITAEWLDFADSIRAGRAPRVSGEDGRDAIAAAERILAQIAAHAWDGAPEGPLGPLMSPMPSTIRGPHWKVNPRSPSPPAERREAG
ncbi:MAG TPA: Gfo/Idh/MocA family oxidoreductase [Pirellulales bacterium]|nr:Gfo/Idh/MocA family oxidoreductase [Pirellulales bacterium]